MEDPTELPTPENINTDLMDEPEEDGEEETTPEPYSDWTSIICPKCSCSKWNFLRCRLVQGIFEFEIYCGVCGVVMFYTFNPKQNHTLTKRDLSYLG